MSFFLLTLIGLIIDPSLATGNIYALDSLAIYDGLLMPENIIGTNLQVRKAIVYTNCHKLTSVFGILNFQNLVNFVASVVGWAFLVPLWRPQERVLTKLMNSINSIIILSELFSGKDGQSKEGHGQEGPDIQPGWRRGRGGQDGGSG